jgi:hypothetical protein
MFGVEAHLGIRVFNTGVRNLDRESLHKALPGPTAPLTPPPKLTQPEAQHIVPKRSQSLLVARYGVILEIPPHHRLYPPQGDLDGLVHPPLLCPGCALQLCHARFDVFDLDGLGRVIEDGLGSRFDSKRQHSLTADSTIICGCFISPLASPGGSVRCWPPGG